MQRPSRYVSVPFPRGRVNCHGYVNAQAVHGRRPCRSSELCNGHSFRDDEAKACRNHRTPLGPSPSWLIQRGGITARCPLLPPPWASTRMPHHSRTSQLDWRHPAPRRPVLLSVLASVRVVFVSSARPPGPGLPVVCCLPREGHVSTPSSACCLRSFVFIGKSVGDGAVAVSLKKKKNHSRR